MFPATAISLIPAIDLALKINPVPGLSFAFALFSFIVSTVNEVQASKTQLAELAATVGQLLATLNAEFSAANFSPKNNASALADLKVLLEEIHRFVKKEQGRSFLKALFNQDSRIAAIAGFYRRIVTTAHAFQISALLNVQSVLQRDKKAREQDTAMLRDRLKALEQSHLELCRTLEINQRNMMSVMVPIQRKLDSQEYANKPEHAFLSSTMQYLTSTSGKQVEIEDWMISSLEVDYVTEIGTGGFGKVYLGTWNHTEVAIKVVRTTRGITPDVSILRKEINIWLTLRHPNILQFLGANTLDNHPFIVMPYVPENARQFLERRTDFDPIYILRDVSLGLEYLHSRKVCHGDLKGVNILVEASARALLCDFGLARSKADATTRSGAKDQVSIMSGSRNWMAPELLMGSLPRTPSDMYAFGMTIYELYLNENPFATLAYSDYIELVVRSGVRPQRPDAHECPRFDSSLWDLAQRCWAADPKARPSAAHVQDRISRSIAAVNPVTEPVADTAAIARRPECVSPDNHFVDDSVALTTHTQNSGQSQLLDAGGKSHPLDDVLCRRKDLQVAVLRKRERMLGKEDPDTLSAMYDLACTYYQLGRLAAAEELHAETAERRKRILSPNHPDTLASIHHLTFVYRRLGRLTEALALGTTVLEKRQQILGADHPNTLGAMHNLALTFYDLHYLTDAAKLQESVLEKQKRVLGRDHPDTLTGMQNLAATYYDLRRFGDAEELLELAWDGRRRILGKDHPCTLRTAEKLIDMYQKLGRPKKAETVAEYVAEARRTGRHANRSA
ncbi:kinase-like domain-containing protein [Mycena pura]|uniref:Kinase-like domain-containing protein n=1 Tax=Mycena pura TaxID=153505 RepID=A0AAD6Y2I2_9AGAR|nr:kinase-like domain-containing protein [Mycena pura]